MDMWNGSVSGMNAFENTTGVTFPLLLQAQSVTALGVNAAGSVDAMMVVDTEGIVRHKGGSNPSDRKGAVNVIQGLISTGPTIRAASVFDFGPEIQPGDSRRLSLEIMNTGTETLDITGISSDLDEISVDVTELTVEPGETDTIQITLMPVQDGSLSGRLTLMSNDTQQPILEITIPAITVVALPPAIELAVDRVDFGDSEMGRTMRKTVRITNSGKGKLVVTGVESDLESVFPSESSFEVEAGASFNLRVSVSPGAEGEFQGTLNIFTNDPEREVIELPISGTGVQIFADPRTDFDNNGKVDFFDFIAFTLAFNDSGSAFDFDNSGRVDFLDFLVFVKSFDRLVL